MQYLFLSALTIVARIHTDPRKFLDVLESEKCIYVPLKVLQSMGGFLNVLENVVSSLLYVSHTGSARTNCQ